MWFTSRQYNNYDDRDFRELCDLVVRLSGQSAARGGPIEAWSLGRVMDWKYGLWQERKDRPAFFRDNARLWFDFLGELVGAAISEGGDSAFHIMLDRRYGFLHAEMLEWVLGTEQCRYNCEIVCAPDDSETANRLLARGFVDQGHAESTFTYTKDGFVPGAAGLPEACSVQDMLAFGSISRQMELKHAAFSHGQELTAHRIHAYHYVKTAPLYDPSMDLLLCAGDGQPLAGCEGFIDYRNRHMEIERVCTHPDWQGKGLARHLITECARRGFERGVELVSITGWNELTMHLYAGFGDFTETRRHSFVLKRN